MNDKSHSGTLKTAPQAFIIRIWYEAPDADEPELRIQTRHVPTGETRYFLAWPALMAYLSDTLDAASHTIDK